MEKKKKVTLLDCTLRDSGYAIDFQFSAHDTKNISLGLEKAGVRMIEVGHGLGLGASSVKHGVALETDEDYLNAAASVLTKAQFGTFLIPGIGSREDIRKAKQRGMGFIRIGINVTEVHAAREFVEFSKESGFWVALNLMKTYAISPPALGELVARIRDWGMDVLYIVDSAGSMLPDQVSEYVHQIKDHSDLEVGFHGHNNLSLSHANSLAAVKAGASYVDGTLRGMGRSAGNAQSEILSYILDQAGYEVNIDPFTLFEISGKYLEPLMLYPQGIPSLEVVYGMSKFHSSYLPLFKRVLGKHDVDLRRLIMAVSQVDCVNPSEELIETIARDLSRTES